jgi:hypothetical protein
MHMTLENSFQRGFRHARGPGRERERNRQRSPVAYLIAGSLIVIWGLGLMLDNLGLGDVRHYMHRAWPAVLVIVGITLLIHRDASRNRYGFWGTVCMFAGLWVYASQRDWIHASFWALLGPMLLVLVGASFVYRALHHPRVDAGTHFNTNLSAPTSRLTTL